MIEIKPDPSNPEHFVLTQTLTIHLDRVMLVSLRTELEAVIAEKAREDFKKPAVLKELRRLTTEHLAKILGIAPKTEVSSVEETK